jgi:hypothetical protein
MPPASCKENSTKKTHAKETTKKYLLAHSNRKCISLAEGITKLNSTFAEYKNM